MVAATLNDVLTLAGKLGREDREMLMEILHKREIEAWRKATAAAGRKALRDFRAGKLKTYTAAELNARLRSLWNAPDE